VTKEAVISALKPIQGLLGDLKSSSVIPVIKCASEGKIPNIDELSYQDKDFCLCSQSYIIE
jgi:hypothetical protein